MGDATYKVQILLDDLIERLKLGKVTRESAKDELDSLWGLCDPGWLLSRIETLDSEIDENVYHSHDDKGKQHGK